MEIKSNTTEKSDLLHPEDAEYIWLPILVLVGVIILAGLVYAMSRVRCSYNCLHFKRRNATRNGYSNVDAEDSDVSMMGANDDDDDAEIGERNSITYLRDSRLQISVANQQSAARNVA